MCLVGKSKELWPFHCRKFLSIRPGDPYYKLMVTNYI
jgi:hypothetical protein